MSKIGKIAPIKREKVPGSPNSMENSLIDNGYTRMPGAVVIFTPYVEIDGRVRTGLDPNALYIQKIADKTERDLEIERVTKLKNELTESFGNIDLGPRAEFWDYSKKMGEYDYTHFEIVKLYDKDNVFMLDDPMQKLAFSWLRVNPRIAPSITAFHRGENPDAQFYVLDDELEQQIVHTKKQIKNKAIVAFDQMSPTKRRKVARLMGLPISDNTPDNVVYNLVDDAFQKSEFISGSLKGANPITIFNQFVSMNDKLIDIKDMVEQAITYNVIRINKSGRVLEGNTEVAATKEDYIKHLSSDDSVEDYIALESAIKQKKILNS